MTIEERAAVTKELGRLERQLKRAEENAALTRANIQMYQKMLDQAKTTTK